MSATTLYDSEVVAKANFVSSTVIAHSSSQSNASAPKAFAKVVIDYEDFTNEGAMGGPPVGGNVGYSVYAVLEEEIVSGVWVGVASSSRKVNTTDGQPTQHIILYGPFGGNTLEGEEHLFPIDGGAKECSVNKADGKARDTNYRVCIVQDITDDTRDQLSEITFTAYFDLHD